MYFFYFLVALIPVLWMVSIYFLRKWKLIYKYVLFHFALICIYFYILFFSKIKFFEHDEYSLKNIFLFLYIIAFHTIIGFIFALYYKTKLSKNGNK